MGLDQWLFANYYNDGGWPWVREKDPAKGESFDAICRAAGLEPGEVESSGVTVTFKVCTWRKANQIHSWFITHCWQPDTEDNLAEIPVTREQLTELVEACDTALDLYAAGRLDDAALVLPPMQGFFFGDYAVDEYWQQDVAETRERIGALLRNPHFAGQDWTWHYQAWY